ncbi:double-stranded RNA-binding protein 2-like [Chenopodium quinoa]|uniref:DRBM domain-containing protein n=1 Tax=Chenopodium quinoa TaxID=63459 RepID=A0A803N8K8_CHEQI|nr:double-stranded RNA-binding protein 2-like [Chenopodium quinoa]
MYKNQLQELAQRSCFNLPSYTCIREGPDHAPRFKAIVNFNGESFESPQYCSTLRQAEHAAAEVALNSLSSRGPSHSLAARILDETGVYKNLLQEISQRVGAPLPHYTTYRSGLGHQPVFTGKVELAGIIFTGEPAKNKKQAEKNAALAAWQSLKQLAQQSGSSSSSSEQENSDELEQVTIARALLSYRLRERMTTASSKPLPFPQTFPIQNPRPSSPQRRPVTASKILPLICPKKTPPRVRPLSFSLSDNMVPSSQSQIPESRGAQSQRFLGMGAPPYIPIRHVRSPCHGIAQPVTIRNSVPCYSAPPIPRSSAAAPPVMRTAPPVRIAPPVCIRQSIPVFSAPPCPRENPSTVPLLESNKADKVEAIQESAERESQESTKSDPIAKPLPPSTLCPTVTRASPVRIALPVCIRRANPVCAAPPPEKGGPASSMEPRDPVREVACEEETQNSAVEKLKQLKL